MKRINLYVPSLSHPRFHKRAKEFLEAGYEVYVYGYDRGYNDKNKFPKGIDVTCLGEIKNGKYLSRFFILLFTLFKMIFFIKNKNHTDINYLFGLDMAYIGYFSSLCRGVFVYEVGDLRNPDFSINFKSRLVSFFERVILSVVDNIVVTSQGFVSDYFLKIDEKLINKIIVVENKLIRTSEINSFERKHKSISAPIVIGFVGVLRYEKTLRPLLEAVSKNKKFQLNIHGDGDLKPLVELFSDRFDNIIYFGRFSYPDDLIKIYQSIDLNYVVYDNTDKNVRLALPNKLYESVYFGVPMVVSCGTYLEERVIEYEVGFSVSPEEINFVDSMLNMLSPELLNSYSLNATKIDDGDLFMKDCEVIESIVKNKIDSL